MIEKIKYFLIYLTIQVVFFFTPILSSQKTIKMVVKKRLSIIRFGDGEFLWMTGHKANEFEDYSDNLKNDLFKVLNNKNKNVLLCISRKLFLKGLNSTNKETKRYYQNLIRELWRPLMKIVPKNRIYGDTCFTRYYIESKKFKTNESFYKNIKRLFSNSTILIIEGYGTKFGIGNDLLNKSKNIKRIICPSTSSYKYKDEIINTAQQYINEFDTIICCLGPTAKIVVFELINLYPDKRYLDMGFFDVDYIYYLHKVRKGSFIKNKFVPGVVPDKNNSIFIDYCESDYQCQVLAKIG